MRDIVETFHQLKETSGRKDKEAILESNKDNTDFKKILKFMYDPFCLTGIKYKKLVKFAQFQDEKHPLQFSNVFEAIDYITTNNSGKDEDIKAIANFINTYDTDIKSPVHDFLQEMFTKDFKCGITASTINKVYGKGTINEFEVLLAKSYKDHGHKVKGSFYVTLKLDGIRCVAIKKNGSVQFFTRQGQPIDELVEIESEIESLLPDNHVFDGELILANPGNLPSAVLFRATQKVVRKDGAKKGLEFHLFDSLPVAEFVNGKSKHTYKERRNELESTFKTLSNAEYLKLLPTLYTGDDKSQISALLNKVITDGHEGLMINTADGYYVTKRSDVLLKVKEMHTVDLRVIGFEEGSGKYKGSLGALIVEYKGYEVKVGSGYTDVERESIWNMKEEIVGGIVEVQYFEESSNQDGGISLRFPVFKRIRDDKSEPSLH